MLLSYRCESIILINVGWFTRWEVSFSDKLAVTVIRIWKIGKRLFMLLLLISLSTRGSESIARFSCSSLDDSGWSKLLKTANKSSITSYLIGSASDYNMFISSSESGSVSCELVVAVMSIWHFSTRSASLKKIYRKLHIWGRQKAIYCGVILIM